MHFALRGYLFIALIALLGVAGTWSEVPAFAGAWLLPAFLLLTGLALEAWYLRGTRVTLRMRIDERLKLGRPAKGAFAFAHNRSRELVLQYARVLPAGTEAVRATCGAWRCRPTKSCWIPPISCRCASAPADSAPCRRGC